MRIRINSAAGRIDLGGAGIFSTMALVVTAAAWNDRAMAHRSEGVPALRQRLPYGNQICCGEIEK
jgi:hypothetical protein